MTRSLAGAAACFLLTGAFLLWRSRSQGPSLPDAPAPRTANSLVSSPLMAPEASPKSRQERRFSRADKNKNGKIEAEEIFGARRKAFAKLDTNGNGALSIDEWGAKTIDRFKGADADKSG